MFSTKSDFKRVKLGILPVFVKCPKCGKICIEQEDKENIKEFGECIVCEKIRFTN